MTATPLLKERSLARQLWWMGQRKRAAVQSETLPLVRPPPAAVVFSAIAETNDGRVHGGF